MDWWIVKQLRAMILTDLRDFVPLGYFESEADKFKSRELMRGYLDSKLGKKLFFESTAIMSPRQVSASDVLMNLGLLECAEAAQCIATQVSTAVEETGASDSNAWTLANQLGDQHIPTFQDNVVGALQQYLRYLTPAEAAPFLPLLGLSSPLQVQGASSMIQNFTFNGNVGSVQAGANAVANVVQNLGVNERASLTTALQQFKTAIECESLSEIQKRELLEITQKCSNEIGSESPDDTRLLDMFNVLGTTVQTFASAPAAYQVLKTTFFACGIYLP